SEAGDLLRAGLLGTEGLIMGKIREGHFLRFNEDAHLFTFAPTGAGKGVSQVIPNLLDHPGSLVCTDIKGENYAITQRRRAAFGPVFALDPFHLQVRETACFNPMDFIRLGTPYARDDAKMLAQMIVPEGAEGTNNRFFATAAQNLLTGLILHVAGSELGEQRNLVTVRRFLTADRDDFALLIRTMKGSGNPAVVEVANRYQQMLGDDPKLAQNIITTAVEHTDFLASEAVSRLLRRSDFHAEDLKRRVISVYMIIPPDQLGVYYPLLRLFIGCFCNALSRTQGAPAQRVLFMLDEFPALRRMEPIEKAIAYARGYGGQFWLIAQDLNQMRGTYGDWAKSLIANCRCKSAFGIADLETARELSAMMGQTTIITESRSRSSGASGPLTGTRSESTGEAARALLYPDEVMRLPATEEIVMIPGMPPIRCRKARYYADPAFAGLYDSWNG